VLRTAPLTLDIAPQGTTAMPDGSAAIVIGRSGGEANLFGNIPGKEHAVEVTVSLGTRITSILRQVDADRAGLVSGQPWTPDIFGCRQLYTGAVQNYLPGLRLEGGLRIAPAITPDGNLRIARVALRSAAPTAVALAACVAPYSPYAAPAAGSDTQTTLVPAPLPIDPSSARPVPGGAECAATPTRLVDDMFDPPQLGSRVTVAGLISVDNVSADVIVGDV
jgi:hypothetical protein